MLKRPFFLFRYPFHTLTSFSCRLRNYDHGRGLDASHVGNECCTYSPSLCIQLQYKAVKQLRGVCGVKDLPHFY